MDAITAVKAARELLKDLTPLKTDCGRLCQGACCQGDEGTGMLLFPGEDALYAACDFARVTPADFTLGDQNAMLFVCNGSCPREDRPLACRLFPLFLAFLKSGKTKVRMDTRAAHVCPLCDYGVIGLDEEFVAAARQAYDVLLECSECESYLRDLHKTCSL